MAGFQLLKQGITQPCSAWEKIVCRLAKAGYTASRGMYMSERNDVNIPWKVYNIASVVRSLAVRRNNIQVRVFGM
jgi:hypothetical protein